jgi:acyl-CoA thioesterase-1
MRLSTIIITLLLAAHVFAVMPLTEIEQKQLTAAETAAKKTSAMREATTTFNAARKAYQLDRQKFAADRNAEVAKAYRKATAVYEEAKRKAMIAADPAVASLLQRADEVAKLGKRKTNEGETVADSDSSKNDAMTPIKDVPGLPRVLLLGDSVSIGYTLQVREKLKGKANVHRIPQNGGATEVGLANMKKWLRDERWDVIHFNFGLHDAKYASETTQRATRDQYIANLQTLIAQMKATGAKLIFATTTPVPNNGVISPTRRFDDVPARNELAKELMKKNEVAIDDLYTLVLPVFAKVGRPNDVHFQPEGYELLATAVAASIETQLPKGASK